MTAGTLTVLLLVTNAAAQQAYPHATEPIGTVRQIYDGALTPDLAVNTFRNIDRLFPTRVVLHGAHAMPLSLAATQLRHVTFTDRGRRYDLDAYLELNRVTGLLVLKDGRIALEHYRLGNTERTHWMSMSVAKSITSTLIGAAIKEHYIAGLTDSVTRYVPALAGSAYDGVTVRDVLMMASGARWNETYTDPASDRRRLLEAQISQVSGSAMAVMRSLPRAAAPGTVNNYSTGETQVAAEILRRAVGRPLATYLSERIWSRFGMEADPSWWLDSPDGVEIGGSGFSATLRDYGRFGLFLLSGGVGRRLDPPERLDRRGHASDHYRLRLPLVAGAGRCVRRRGDLWTVDLRESGRARRHRRVERAGQTDRRRRRRRLGVFRGGREGATLAK
ncbi:MAG TPA: serine hydrolase [Gemmatimonadales bacterium]|nr:serine hydrolase [Gemmatimonadales bacterium]